MFAIFSILNNLSDGLLRPGRSEANLCFNESYENGTRLIRGLRGGKHAAKRPIETSAVVQKVGGVAKPLVLPVEGSKETVQCQCLYLRKGNFIHDEKQLLINKSMAGFRFPESMISQ